MLDEERSGFSGTIPENYQRLLVPMLFEGYARDLARRVRVDANMAVLETACGTGAVTRELRRRLEPSVRIIATDLSRDMADFAKSVDDPPLENTSFRDADATQLKYADNKFAAVVSQFGVMLFDDRPRAYAEALRVLQPGGVFAFSVWDSFQHNPLPARISEAVTPLLPADTPPFLTAPFAYNDLTLMRNELEAAGFGEIRLCVLPSPLRAPVAADTARALVLGSPLGAQLSACGKLDEGLDAIEQTLVTHYGNGPIRERMQAIVVEAFKPS